jgi:hypothetical protein
MWLCNFRALNKYITGLGWVHLNMWYLDLYYPGT